MDAHQHEQLNELKYTTMKYNLAVQMNIIYMY